MGNSNLFISLDTAFPFLIGIWMSICKKKFIYLFMAVLSLSCCVGFSLVVANGAYPLVAVCGLLIVVASPAAERGLLGFSSCSSGALEHRLNSYGAQA